MKPEAGSIVRYVYRGEFEYAEWNADGTRMLICSQTTLDEWKAGQPIEPIRYCDNEELQRRVKAVKERLRDGTTVIQGVWKGEQFQPRKTITT